MFIKKKSIFAHHLLIARWQQPGVNLNQYRQDLEILNWDCDLKALTTEQAQDEFIMDTFIGGILSHQIKQKLPENKTLNLTTV